MSERTPILYLAPWVDLGGSDKGTIDWFKHIDRGRWAPSLITTQPSPNRWLHQVEPYADELWDLPSLMPGADFPEFILGFVESRGVRAVHIMNSRLAFDLLPDISCLPEPPAVVVQMHAEEPDQAGYVRYATRRYGNLIDAFSVTSEHQKSLVAGYEIPPSRIEVIYSGVDGEGEFNPEAVAPLPLPGDGPPRILWPGRLVEQKDPMLTLAVLSAVRDRGREFVADIVGDGQMADAVHARARDLGLDEQIRWHPPSREISRWYRSADLVLMTSEYEGVPYVIFEALAMGVPVVAPALPGNRELMDEDSGALVDPRDDVDAYAEAIVRLLDDRPRREEMGARSRERLLSKFSLAEMGRRHDALYERLLDSSPASSRWRVNAVEDADAPSTERLPPVRLPREGRRERAVGVGIPCYRHGIYLDECVESVKRQILAPESIVIVDDGSDDPETIAALARWEEDPEVTVLRQPDNRGPSAARNRALDFFDSSYVLWIDADDRLLPGALDSMVAKLESAPEGIGFIYPHAEHIGNRFDFVEMPAYNRWLLMEVNFCPSPALFDRRLFADHGFRYPEDIVVGHEDWDLILQLAERDVSGLHADGPTFLYRKQGFSRVSAVDFGPDDFQALIEARHPTLYGNRTEIKAEWAPALSIVLLEDGATGGWADADVSMLAGQSCRDFEVVGSAGQPGVTRVVDEELAARDGWPQAAIRAARGRWVCLLRPSLAPMLHEPAFVERLLRCFAAHGSVSAIVLAGAPDVKKAPFSPLGDAECRDARPSGVVFQRALGSGLPNVEARGDEHLLDDLALGLQTTGLVQWRLAKHRPGDAESPAPAAPAERSTQLDLNLDRAGDRSEAATRQSLSWQPPALPELNTRIRRWEGEPDWMPPGTQPLCRHVRDDGEFRIVTNHREPPPGFSREFDLGAIQMFASPGTRRLVHRAGTFELSDDQDRLPEGAALGYVEERDLPMHDRLELREVPDSGQRVLVAGSDDPLLGVTRPIAVLGWLDAFPILPRGDLMQAGYWGVATLHREIDIASGRHLYRVDDQDDGATTTPLGAILRTPSRGAVALRLRDDGRLDTELARAGRASRDPRKLARWIAQPLKAPESDLHWSASARARHLVRQRGQRRLSTEEGTVLGWLARDGLPGAMPLFSTTHPATGDQFVTCDPHDAMALGYQPDGVLGFILDAKERSAPRPTVPWGRIA